MCEYCGCRGVPPIAELMEEHDVILDDAYRIRRALTSGDREEALRQARVLAAHLEPHVRREEQGIFAALRQQGEYVDEVSMLEREHLDLDTAIGHLDPADPGFDRELGELLVALGEHVERENLGIFPVSVVTLGADGWELVDRAREVFPTFLTAGPDPSRTPVAGR